MEHNDLFLNLFIITAFVYQCSCTSLEFNPKSVTISSGDCEYVNLTFKENCPKNGTIHVQSEHITIATAYPIKIEINQSECKSWIISICGHEAGINFVKAFLGNSSDDKAYLGVYVGNYFSLSILSQIIGWIYFAAWGISFYPQIYENYSRKSVIGLNFDFISLNIVGFIAYSLYNVGLRFIPYIRNEYKHKYPRISNPVELADVFFSVHGVWACLVTIFQCFIYERGNQKISLPTKIFLCFLFGYIAAILACAYFNILDWLDFLYYCSYVKLVITLIKYTPQALMNYRRKSTEGWSIGNVLLDVTGSVFSMLQMIINSYNFNDWDSIMNDPTKFGLGLFSLGFDTIFIYQHYVLYRKTGEESMTTPFRSAASDTVDSEVPLHI